MTGYVMFYMLALLAIAAAIGVNMINAASPTHVQSIKHVLWGCFSLPTALIYLLATFIYFDFVVEVEARRAVYLRVITPILTALLIVPLVILEVTFPGQGWAITILIAAFMWGLVPLFGFAYQRIAMRGGSGDQRDAGSIIFDDED